MKRTILESTIPVSAGQFAIFRIVLGFYLLIHFVQLLPWAGEIFGGQGILPSPESNLIPQILPNPLWTAQDGRIAWLCVFGGCVAALGIISGRSRVIWCSAAWLVWAWLFARNNLILNPSIPYVGLLLLICAGIPRGESYVTGKPPDPDWQFPAIAWWTVWILLAAGYTFSGIAKLSSPSWIDGSALRDVMQNPLARDNWARQCFLMLPNLVTNLLSWGALLLEILFLPLALIRPTRGFAWAAMVAMHLGILVLIDFADLTVGMLVVHVFTWRREWLPKLGKHQRAAAVAADAGALAEAVGTSK
ncbi:MAG: hypothetical protein R3F19_10730 [Verrucomicrobiales bacterium]